MASPATTTARTLRERVPVLLHLGLPIIGGMISQNILNLVDTAMVGRLGDAALAGVGMASYLNFVLGSFVLGISGGVQAMAARRVGEGRRDEAARVLNAALLLVVLATLPMTAIFFSLASGMVGAVNADPNVVAVGAPYLQMRLFGMLAVGCNFAFRGYWNGVGNSRIYLRTLLLMHALNVLLNYGLIFGNLGLPRLGAVGAGLATTLSTYVGTGYYVLLSWRHARHEGFLAERPTRGLLAALVRLSLPNSTQVFFFAVGQATLFWILGRIGTPELAAGNVLINLMLVMILPAMGLGLASASLVGQALGRGDREDARRWGWQVATLTALGLGVCGLPMLLVPDLLLGGFITEPTTLDLARTPLRLFACTLPLEAFGMVLMQTHIGAGATRTSMRVSIGMQWGVMLPTAYLFGVTLGHGLIGAWLGYVAARTLQALLFARLWQRGHWADARL